MSDAHIQKELAILAAIERLGLKPNLGNAADLEPLWQAGYDARNEWHKIEDGLPKLHEDVLICTEPFGHAYIAALSDHHHLHFTGHEYDWELNEVTRWMYIPE